jgi:transposase InsO family protein
MRYNFPKSIPHGCERKGKMAARTTVDQREVFIQRRARGETYVAIAQACGVSWQCVWFWWQRFRRGEGVRSHYTRERHSLLMRFSPLMRYVILRLKLAHPHWGPRRIRYHVQQRPSLAGQPVPSATQIGRYLHQWVRFRRHPKRNRTPPELPARPVRVHQCWQVDFKLGIALADGTQVNLHTIHDPVGEVCIAARVTPAGSVGHKPTRVSLAELQTTLRLGFCQWGTLPTEIQTDNEALFTGNPTERFPSRFALWLVGLGIQHHPIRPGKPTDNAGVERNHRTLNEYVVADQTLTSLTAFQHFLDQAWYELAFALPSYAQGCAGQPPVVAHPDLLRPPRPYQAHLEWALFDLQRVDHFLAQFTWQRKVTTSGQVSLGGQHHYYSVGRAFAQQLVWVRFDPADRHFVFFPDASATQLIARRQARHLSVADLTGLPPGPQQLALALIFPKD